MLYTIRQVGKGNERTASGNSARDAIKNSAMNVPGAMLVVERGACVVRFQVDKVGRVRELSSYTAVVK